MSLHCNDISHWLGAYLAVLGIKMLNESDNLDTPMHAYLTGMTKVLLVREIILVLVARKVKENQLSASMNLNQFIKGNMHVVIPYVVPAIML